MRLNIYHICPFGPGFNIGNFMIQQSVRRMLGRLSDRGINFITVPASGFGSKAGLTKQIVYDINQTADGVIVGGGNLFENGEIAIDRTALQALRRPMLVYSSSYGRIYGPDLTYVRRTDAISDSDLLALLERADVVLSRDEATRKHIESVMRHSDHEVGGCPSVYISELAAAEFDVNGSEEGRFPLLAVRNPEQMNIPLSRKIHVHALSEHCLQVLERRQGKPAVVLCNDQRDIEYAMSFGREILYTSDVYEYFQILNDVSEAISFRVHTSLPLWSLGRPTLNLSYDERSESLIDTLDMRDLDLNIIEECDSVGEKIEARLASLPGRIEAPARWEQLRGIQEAGIRRFLKLLEA
ncbi:MAG: hypothetical protein HLX50_11560 [Alteromonadaceae bacterium]|nr:hypothetical protein [Alteromonadaceae bacterium]